jgi:hypothetical protein
MNPVFLAVFRRHRHLDKVPVPTHERHPSKLTSQYRHNKLYHDLYYTGMGWSFGSQ